MDVEDRQRPFDATSNRHGQPDVHLSTDEDCQGKSQLLFLQNAASSYTHLHNIIILPWVYIYCIAWLICDAYFRRWSRPGDSCHWQTSSCSEMVRTVVQVGVSCISCFMFWQWNDYSDVSVSILNTVFLLLFRASSHSVECHLKANTT